MGCQKSKEGADPSKVEEENGASQEEQNHGGWDVEIEA